MTDHIDVTDDELRRLLESTRRYTIVVLRPGPNRDAVDADGIIWEHGRRNAALRAAGTLSIVLPVARGSDISGIGVFDASTEATRAIMEGDPAVRAGVLTWSMYETASFPGDALPA